MNLFEYEGKQLFASYGIPTPASQLVTDITRAPNMAFPYVLKAQTMTGGRGKAGGIQVCRNGEEYAEKASQIKNMTIKGHPVYALLAEEMVKPDRELYLSITLQGVKQPTLIASAMGGMEIEKVAAEQPEEILRIEIDPFLGLKDYQLRQLAKTLGVKNGPDFQHFVYCIQNLFFTCNAKLVEINPLGVFGEKLIAMDAKVSLDDHISLDGQDWFSELTEKREQIGYQSPKGDGTTITYVPLEGRIGLISDGAGTGMLTLDMIQRLGGTVASFCELGGTTNADVMYKAMEYTMQKDIDGILVVLIGGFNRMDDMANGITRYLADHPIKIPMVTRMCGTMEEEGIAMMKQAGLYTCRGLTQAVEKIINDVKEAV